MRCPDRGVALLEVLVALVMLSAAGIAYAGLVSAGLHAERVARERERLLETEERVLAALTLLKRDELDRRLGQHAVGEFIIDVERPERALYRVALAQEESPEVEDLVTVVYRPEPRRAP